MTTADTATAVNPYPGPRSFATGETLYGRDGEVARLLDMLIAERIVLLCSPSGAGKTSLIQAGLIPRLREEGFNVLPVVRVGLHLGAGGETNRYRTCAITSLQAGLPADEQLSTADGMTLREYLTRRRGDDQRDEVLVFDQFEELLTLDPTDITVKQEFLADIGEALRDRHLWALFAMREEYIAGLDPYLRLIPTRLRARFRLDLLDERAARLAMQAPAQTNGVTFSEEAATRLIDDLRRVRVQRPGDSSATEPGPYIEPVQLQVVCRQLWARLPDGAQEIGEDAVEAMGDVSLALAGYYEERVQAAARPGGISERAIRDWFEKRLIIGQGFRNQVLELPAGSRGAEVAQDLEDDHLIRADWRRGARWYELAHDRLIEPVKASNAAWREHNLSTVQRQAALWDEEDRIDGLLLTGEAMEKAESWLDEHAADLDATEREFVEACRRAQRDAERERRTARRNRRIAIVLAALSLLAVSGFVAALVWFRNAQRETRTAESRELAAAAESVVNIDPSLAILLARQAVGDGDNPLLDLRAALYRAVYNSDVQMTLPPSATDVAFSPDGRKMLTGTDGGSLELWDAESGSSVRQFQGHDQGVEAVVFNPDGTSVASASSDGTARIWDPTSEKPVHTLSHEASVHTVAVSPDGTTLATGDDNGTATLWETSSGNRLADFTAHDRPVRGVVFTPHGHQLVTVGDDGLAKVWQLADPSQPLVLGSHQGPIFAVAVSPDGSRVATAGADRTVRVWDWARGGELQAVAPPSAGPRKLSGHELAVLDVAFSADGTRLATAGADDQAKLWDVGSGQEVRTLAARSGRVLSVAFHPERSRMAMATQSGKVSVWDITEGHARLINGVAVTRDGRQVATASYDGTARLWNAHSGDLERALDGRSAQVSAVAYDLSGDVLATADQDGTARTWNTTTGQELKAFPGHSSAAGVDDQRPPPAVNDVTFSADGLRLATASADGTVRVWDAQSGALLLTPQENGERVNAVAFSPEGDQLAATSANIVRVWDATTGAEIAPPLEGHEDEVTDVTFSPDGRYLATASADASVRLWDARSHKELRTLARHTAIAWSVAFSPDGKRVASASKDRTVKVSDVDSGAEYVRISTPLEMYGVAFRDNGTVAAVGQTPRPFLYTLDLEELIRLADQRSVRAMTEVECERYLGRKDC